MASGSFNQIYVQCPFYKRDDGMRRVICEGIIDNSSISISYMSKGDFKKQLEVFCCEHFKKCEVYNMIMKTKYEEEEC